jgi:SAM-dependent methyltransferase
MKCICGGTKYKQEKRDGFIVNSYGESIPTEIDLGKCLKCGVLRQIDLPFSNENEYDDYYKNEYPPTKRGFINNNYQSDLVAGERLFNRYNDKYGISKSKRMLDIGCGSGSFVDVCNKKGIEAYGCELGKYYHTPKDNKIYFSKFENVNFPTDYADTIFCSDVIEHVLDPVNFLNEVFRVLDQKGRLFVEFPHFYHDIGKAHWKKIEHIWYFTKDEFIGLLRRIGFVNVKCDELISKVDAKLLFIAEKPIQKRTKILFPPGMGDSMWSIIKLESFLKRNKIKSPVDAYIVCPKSREHNGHERSVPFLEMFPFVNSTGVVYQFDRANPEHRKTWESAYGKPDKTIFKNILDCDYFVSYNGYNISYKTLDKSDQYDCNWHPKRFISLEEERFKSDCIKKYGDYLVLFFPLYGMYKSWIDKIPTHELANIINRIVDYTKLTPVIAGKEWDRDTPEIRRFIKLVNGAIDLTGKTTVEQVFGLIRGAKGMIAYPCGLPMMATVLGQKVLMIWDEHWEYQGHKRPFAYNFAKNCCPPETVGKTYKIEMIDGLTPEKFVLSAINLLTGENIDKIDKGVVFEKPILLSKSEKIDTKQETKKQSENKKYSELPHTEIDIYCVLKSGGVYTEKDVAILESMLNRNITHEYNFHVLSDMNVKNKITLENNWPGWWSKVELFKHQGPALYFDLDTVILKNIDRLVVETSKLKKGEMRMLIPFNPRRRANGNWASGIMAWYADLMPLMALTSAQIDDLRMDQTYIEQEAKRIGITIKPINNWVKIYSQKWHCKNGHPPKNADIVCFHGKIKPKHVSEKWVLENYR